MQQAEINIDSERTALVVWKAGGTLEVKGPCLIRSLEGGRFVLITQDKGHFKPRAWMINTDVIHSVETD